ncbi:MAG: SUF system Fe-S cluster assembly regulator [Acidobacteriota bacterium]
MIRITKQTDYGIVLASHLATEPGRRFNAAVLSEETGLPLPMVSKILKLLAREGVLTSHRGVHGGYCLARPASEIRISEVIATLEGPIAITECIDDSPGVCSQEATCPMRSNWQVINAAIRSALDQITLAEMARPLATDPSGATEKLVSLNPGEFQRPATP